MWEESEMLHPVCGAKGGHHCPAGMGEVGRKEISLQSQMSRKIFQYLRPLELLIWTFLLGLTIS